MRLRWFISSRYLFARRKRSVINLISHITLGGLSVGTAALIVVLSVYNGIGELTQTLFSTFDPELIIEPSHGKTFRMASLDSVGVGQMKEVRCLSAMVEEHAWLTNKQNSCIAQLRGVDENYAQLSGLDTSLYEGSYLLRSDISADGPIYFLLFGSEIFYQLGLTSFGNTPVGIHIPKRGRGMGMTMDEAFNNRYAYPAGQFFIQQDVDARYVVTDIALMRQLMGYAPDEVTAVALAVDSPRSLRRCKAELSARLGDRFTVKDRLQQQPLYYKVYRSERLGIYLILSLIILIATLNLVASLALLIIDKRRDIAILQSMGMTQHEVRRLFFCEGTLISAIGCVAGLLIGFVVCGLQQQFGLIKMGGNFVVAAFPVSMHAVDFLLTFALVMTLSLVAVFFTVRHTRTR